MMFGMKNGTIKNNLFRHSISRNILVCPHEIPTMANSTPEKPVVGASPQSIHEGKKAAHTDMTYAAMTVVVFGLCIHIMKRQTMFAARCHRLAWQKGYKKRVATDVEPVKPYS